MKREIGNVVKFEFYHSLDIFEITSIFPEHNHVDVDFICENPLKSSIKSLEIPRKNPYGKKSSVFLLLIFIIPTFDQY